MGILTDLTPPDRSATCSVGRLVASLEEEDREVLLGALDDERWSTSALVTELRRRGLKVSKDSMLAHRKKVCVC